MKTTVLGYGLCFRTKRSDGTEEFVSKRRARYEKTAEETKAKKAKAVVATGVSRGWIRKC